MTGSFLTDDSGAGSENSLHRQIARERSEKKKLENALQDLQQKFAHSQKATPSHTSQNQLAHGFREMQLALQR